MNATLIRLLALGAALGGGACSGSRTAPGHLSPGRPYADQPDGPFDTQAVGADAINLDVTTRRGDAGADSLVSDTVVANSTPPVFACDPPDDTLTFDQPCRVGLPLTGAFSSVECSAYHNGSTGKWTFIADLGRLAAHVNEPMNVASFAAGPMDAAEFAVRVSGSVEFSRVDVAARTFSGRFLQAVLVVDGVRPATCQGENKTISGVAGDFL